MHNDLEGWVKSIVRRFVNESPENSLRNEDNERAWADPLVGFSNGADPLYEFYKEDIGPFFMTPTEWFDMAFPGMEVEPTELTVMSWVLPQIMETKSEHRLPRIMPTERWARARIYGEEFNEKLRQHVVEKLLEAVYPAVSPMISTQWERADSAKYGFASNWSERHAAGLGTFGLCDGLITPREKAMRTGSVIAWIDIPPSPRPYEDHNAYCLWYAKGTCRECIPRCPAGAISETGHNKEICSAYLKVTRRYVEETWGFKGYGCGLCQTGVTCESGIPSGL
jgi:hypothetical protein